LADDGHVALRLPPCNPELISIETVTRAIVSNCVAVRRVKFELKDIKNWPKSNFIIIMLRRVFRPG
jgi:transposase